MQVQFKLQPEIRLIAACDQNLGIGFENTIPWWVPEDMKFFARTTRNHPVVMGRLTYESLPPKGLPNRYTVVLSRNQTPIVKEGHFQPDLQTSRLDMAVRSIMNMLVYTLRLAEEGNAIAMERLRLFVGGQYAANPLEFFARGVRGSKGGIAIIPIPIYVIGGEAVYSEALSHASSAYVTRVHGEFATDRKFPDLEQEHCWTLTHQSDVATSGHRTALKHHYEVWTAPISTGPGKLSHHGVMLTADLDVWDASDEAAVRHSVMIQGSPLVTLFTPRLSE